MRGKERILEGKSYERESEYVLGEGKFVTPLTAFCYPSLHLFTDPAFAGDTEIYYY